jgi:hypothetical protein
MTKDNCSQCGKALGYEKKVHANKQDIYCDECWEHYGIRDSLRREKL